jgi:hypothetical protein
MRRPLCVISSLISHAEAPLSYSDKRSVFSPAERLRQTMCSIESVRTRIPGATILVVEMGLDPDPPGLADVADKYEYVGGSRFVRWACDGPHKGLGEAAALLASLGGESWGADYYFKLSGRYWLNESFSLRSWSREKMNVRRYSGNISTRLYGFPARQLARWKRGLWFGVPLLAMGASMEDVLAATWPRSLTNDLAPIGVSGLVAPSGEELRE